MADFLSRLVERSTGRAAVAHPVVAPLFATGPEQADSTPEVETGSAPAVTKREAPGIARDFVAPGTPQPTPALAPPSSRATPRHIAFAEPLLERRARADLEDRLAREPLALRSSLPVESGAAVAATPTDVRADRPNDIDNRAAPPRLLPHDPSDSAPAGPRPLHGLEPAEPAPIVRISIGRIDVRAVALPAIPTPGPVPVRKDDRLSLEDYLRPPKGRERRRQQ